MKIVHRGEIYTADLNPFIGSEQGGFRPVVIIQNDTANRFSPTIIAAALTTQNKPDLPMHIKVYAQKTGLLKDSIILMEQIRTLDKRRLCKKIGELDEEALKRLDTALEISFGLRKS